MPLSRWPPPFPSTSPEACSGSIRSAATACCLSRFAPRSRLSLRGRARISPTSPSSREQTRLEKEPSRRISLGLEAVKALGGSLAALALQGGPDGMAEAAAVLDRGALADWSYRPLLETRLTVATLRRDGRAKADTAARLARLDALARRN